MKRDVGDCFAVCYPVDCTHGYVGPTAACVVSMTITSIWSLYLASSSTLTINCVLHLRFFGMHV